LTTPGGAGRADTSYGLKVRAVDTENQISQESSATARTVTPTVRLSKGAHANTGGCTSSSCAYVVLTLSNFTPGTTVTVNPSDTHPTCSGCPEMSTHTYTVNGSGDLTDSTAWFYGYSGYSVNAVASADGKTYSA